MPSAQAGTMVLHSPIAAAAASAARRCACMCASLCCDANHPRGLSFQSVTSTMLFGNRRRFQRRHDAPLPRFVGSLSRSHSAPEACTALRLAASTRERSVPRDVSRPVLRLVLAFADIATREDAYAPSVRRPTQARSPQRISVQAHPSRLRHCGLRGRGVHRRPAELDAHLPCPRRRSLDQAVLLDWQCIA